MLIVGATEVALRIARPYSPALRHLLYESSLPAAFAPIATLPELMDTTVLGWAPLQERDGYVLNSRSLPTPEYAQTKAPGTFRIIALGDSFTFERFPVSRHWTTLAAADLAQRTGERIELIRHGVPATGPQFELRLFEIEGARLSPDLVVLAFYVGNDFFDELGGAFVHSPLDRLALALRARSLAWRFLTNLLRVGSGVEPGRATSAPSTHAGAADAVTAQGGHEAEGFARDFDERAPTFTEDAFADIEATRLSLCDRSEAGRFRVRLERVLDAVDELAEKVRASGARLVVMVIPDEFQVDPGVLAMAARRAGKQASDYDLERPQRELVEALDARGVPALDLLPASRRAAAEGSLYLPRNTHWNSAGNGLAAAELVRFLVEGGLVAFNVGGPGLAEPRASARDDLHRLFRGPHPTARLSFRGARKRRGQPPTALVASQPQPMTAPLRS